MDQHFTIRKAQVDDAQAIKEIMNDAFGKYRKISGITGRVDALEEALEDIIRDMKEKLVFVADVNNFVVGTLRISQDASCNAAYISRFGVRCGYSNRGIGTSLLKYADDFISKAGIKKVSLHSALDNKNLISFYLRRGFHVEAVTGERGYKRALLVKEY